jgi:uncharacterized repeat protein (TIGR02543 family)
MNRKLIYIFAGFSLILFWSCNLFDTKEYTVTFDPVGGECVPVSTMKVKEGEPLYTIPFATRNNDDFDGWYTEKDGKGIQYFKDTIINRDITLYAKWIMVKSRITISISGENQDVYFDFLDADYAKTDLWRRGTGDSIQRVNGSSEVGKIVGTWVNKLQAQEYVEKHGGALSDSIGKQYTDSSGTRYVEGIIIDESTLQYYFTRNPDPYEPKNYILK